MGGEDRQADPASGFGGAFDPLRRAHEAVDGRARDRRAYPRRHRVPRPHGVRERVGAELGAGPAQLGIEALPARAGQRQRAAGQVRRLPQLPRRGGGTVEGDVDRYYYGRRPSECIIPNFRNLGKQDADFVGGYTTFTGAYRERGVPSAERIGGAFKDAQAQAGPWKIYL